MIRMVDVPVTLHVNKLKTEQINTNQIFTKNDNYVSNFVFTVKDSTDVELVYSDITSATMIIKLGNYFVEPLLCDINLNNISINIKEQALAYEGLAVCQLKLFGSSGQVYTTNPFTYIVQSAVHDETKQIPTDLSLINLLVKMSIDGTINSSLPIGGTVGQVLTKTGDATYGWGTPTSNFDLSNEIVYKNQDNTNLKEFDYDLLPSTKNTDGKVYIVFPNS